MSEAMGKLNKKVHFLVQEGQKCPLLGSNMSLFVRISWSFYKDKGQQESCITDIVGYSDTAYSDKPLIVTLFVIPKWLVC